tara:strand:+ start:278 stop:1315 length:1038 start_codon:yes stop_codon:yes gene_type:complete
MKLPPYIYRQKTNGRTRLRFEKRGLPKRWIHARPGTNEFLDEYRACLDGERREPKVDHVKSGTIAALVRQYERSAAFGELGEATRKQRSRVYAIVTAKVPDAPAASLTSKKVRELRDNRAATPVAANNFVKCLGYLYRWGQESGLVDRNPADGVARLKPLRKGGIPVWTMDEVKAFRRAHAVGTKAHLALCLFLFTGARISDARVLGRHNVRDGWIAWKQKKGGGEVEVSIPILAPLQEAIDAYRPKVQGIGAPFLAKQNGQAHASEKSFANWFAKQCGGAGVEKSAHGIRKALGGLLADMGCSEHEIMAILGHTNPRTSAIYTRSARRKSLAESGAEKLRGFKW